jgi:ankyrin repeat protein
MRTSKVVLISCTVALVAVCGGYVYQTQYLPSELRTAATRGDLARVQGIIAAGVDINAPLGLPSNSALNRAIEGGDPTVVKAFIDAGADVNAASETGMTPLMFAAFFGDARIVRLVLTAGARTDAIESRHKNTALLFAVRKAHVDAVNILLEAGANPNQGAEWGDAPLCRAQALARSDLEQVLRNAGGECGPATTARSSP